MKKTKIDNSDAPLQTTLSKRLRLHPKKLALIARDFNMEKNRGKGRFKSSKRGFDPFFPDIARICSNAGCDVLLFSLWSNDKSISNSLRKNQIFPQGTNHKAAIFEVTNSTVDDSEKIAFWHRKNSTPTFFTQFFGKSNEKKRQKQFIAEVHNRILGPSFLIFCGETNIIRTKRGSKKIIDDFNFLDILKTNGIRFLFNPIHNYMVRFEMKIKRAVLSQSGKYCISVWNRGMKKANEAKIPWTAFYNGEDITYKIEEIANPIAEQPGVRIGVLKLK